MRNTLRFLFLFIAALGLAAGVRAATVTTTVRNLNTAFAGESNAAHRYQLFAKQADQEGLAQVAKLFRASAVAEEIHRERHSAAIKKLGGQADPVTLENVNVGTTAENLRAAIDGESYERDTMYPGFIATAKAEDARVAVRSLQAALSAEKEHARLYQQALDQLGKNAAADYFVCRDCGYTVTQLPKKECPVCSENPSKFKKIG
jgi:rubrerythrin